MKYGVYSVRDQLSCFLRPTFDINDATAIRNFEHAVLNTEDSLFFSHPEDYALFRLGTFDDQNASFVMDAVPSELISASQIMSKVLHERISLRKDEKDV